MPKLILILVCLFSLSSLHAQDADMKPLKDVTQLKAKLKEASQATNTIDADFIQKKHLSFMASDVTTSGHFSFKKERKIRWEYKKPYQSIIVINNNDIYMKDEDKTSHFDAQSNKMFKGINDMMVATVKGDMLNTTDFKADYFENDKFYFVRLTPVKSEMKNYLKNIELYFDKKDMSVAKLKLIELSNDFTYIEYKNKTINKPLSDEIFTVK